MGEKKTGSLRVSFDRRLKLELHGAKVTSDAADGPLSTLTASGRAIITTICKGILGVASLPLKIIGGILRGALRIAGGRPAYHSY